MSQCNICQMASSSGQ